MTSYGSIALVREATPGGDSLFGSARDRSVFGIQCRAHVAILLKRLFPRVYAGERGRACLDVTDSTCFDLRWFLERYPMELDDEARAVLDAGARGQEERVRLLEQFRDPEYVPRAFALAKPPRAYQAAAAELALRSGGLLVADDVGLGKTVTALAMISDSRTRPAAVVTLTHLPDQWEEKAREFLPGASVRVLRTGQQHDLTRWRGRTVPFPDIVVLNYHKLSGWAAYLAERCASVVYDEVQELRTGPGSAKYFAAWTLSQAVRYRLGLSATPIYNYGDEMHHVLECLQPGVLGSKAEFEREWAPGGFVADPEAFGAFLRDQGLMVRTTRRSAGRELPPVDVQVHTVESNSDVLEREADVLRELAERLLAAGARPLDQMRAAGELDMRVRQATGLAKAPAVAAWVAALVAAGEKVVLFGWHHAVYEVWRAAFRTRGIHVAWYTGEESPAAKSAARDAFVAGEASVLVMSLRAGAGLDGLQEVCSCVVFGELDWSPGVHLQCVGRVARDGQKSSTAVFYLVSEDGSDPIVIDTLGVKRRQSEGIVNPDRELVAELQADPERIKDLARRLLDRRGAA